MLLHRKDTGTSGWVQTYTGCRNHPVNLSSCAYFFTRTFVLLSCAVILGLWDLNLELKHFSFAARHNSSYLKVNLTYSTPSISQLVIYINKLELFKELKELFIVDPTMRALGYQKVKPVHLRIYTVFYIFLVVLWLISYPKGVPIIRL